MNAKYVRTEDGLYLLQVENEVLFPRWGFALCDSEQSWEGGFGIATEWSEVSESELPEDIRRELGRVRKALEALEG